MEYLQKAPRLKRVQYTTVNDEDVDTNLLVVPAIMEAIPAKVRTNSNDTPWRLVTVKVFDPLTKKVVTRQAQLFEKSYIEHEDAFSKGSEIECHVQIEGGPDVEGLAKAQLPEIERFNLKAYADVLQSAEAITDTP